MKGGGRYPDEWGLEADGVSTWQLWAKISIKLGERMTRKICSKQEGLKSIKQ